MAFESNFEHREELIRTAIDEFVNRGYDDASINRILIAAGMSKGQFYHHFSSKEELYLALVEQCFVLKQEWFAKRPPSFEEDFFSDLYAQIRASVEFARTHEEVDAFVTSVLAERGRPIYAKIVHRLGFSQGDALGNLVESAYAKGQFREGLHLDFVQVLLIGMLNHLPDIIDLHAPADLGHVLDDFVSFLRRGLGRV